MKLLLVVCVAAAVAAGFLVETMLRASASTTGTGGAVYTANNSGSSVSVLNGDTLAPLDSDIPTNGTSGAVAVSPDGTRVYSVGGNDGDRITVIDATTNNQITSVGLAPNETLSDLVVSPDGSKVYVTGRQFAFVYVFDTATNTRTDMFPLDAIGTGNPFPEAIAISPQGDFVFVLAASDARVQKMRTSDGAVVDSVAVSNIRELAVSGTTLVVVGNGGPLFFSTATLDPLPLPVTADIGTQIDVAAGGGQFFVLDESYAVLDLPIQPESPPAFGSPSVDVYDAATGMYVESFDLGGGSTVLGIAATQDGSCCYVSRVGSENVGSVSRVSMADGTIGPTGNTGGTPRRVALKEVLASTPIESFFLPRKVDVKFNGPGKDTLKAAGTYDDGGAMVSYSQPVTIRIGGFTKTFTPVAKGAAFTFKDANVSVKLTPNVKTSSRGIFKIDVKKSDLMGLIDVGQPVEFHFTATGLPDAGGTVLLTNGRYRIQKVRGALVTPGFFPVKAKAKLGDGAVDTLTLIGGFATEGETPAVLGPVRVGFGPTFSRTIQGASFQGRKGVFTFASPGPEKLKVVIDFPRELVVVTAKKIELGPLASPTIDITFDAGGGKGAFTSTVRVASAGTKRAY